MMNFLNYWIVVITLAVIAMLYYIVYLKSKYIDYRMKDFIDRNKLLHLNSIGGSIDDDYRSIMRAAKIADVTQDIFERDTAMKYIRVVSKLREDRLKRRKK